MDELGHWTIRSPEGSGEGENGQVGRTTVGKRTGEKYNRSQDGI